MAYCHFELCRDCGIGCFSELLLADIRRLSVVAVMFLYQITVFFYNKTQQHHFWNFILMTQCKLYVRAAAVAVDKDRSLMGRCNIYRHPGRRTSVVELSVPLDAKLFLARGLVRVRRTVVGPYRVRSKVRVSI